MKAIGTMLGVLLVPAVCLAAQGEVSFLEGSATRRPEVGASVVLGLKSPVSQGDTIETSTGTRLEISLPDGSAVRLGPTSRLKLDAAAFTDSGRSLKATLLIGKVWSKVTSVFGSERNFEIKTSHAVAGVRGTIFRVEADKASAVLVKVYAGTVAVAGSSSIAPPSGKPGERKQVPGPKEVSRQAWEKLVSAMMQVRISAAGVAEEPTRFSEVDEVHDAFALWNRARDGSAGP